MSEKSVSENINFDLPTGKRVAFTPVHNLPFNKRELFMSDDKNMLWYVLIVFSYRDGQPFSITKPIQAWIPAQSKTHARQIAERYQADGHEIMDILQGTRKTLLEKYKGLR